MNLLSRWWSQPSNYESSPEQFAEFITGWNLSGSQNLNQTNVSAEDLVEVDTTMRTPTAFQFHFKDNKGLAGNVGNMLATCWRQDEMSPIFVPTGQFW